MMEYAVTQGEGTLIDYGYFPIDKIEIWLKSINEIGEVVGYTIITGPCDDDCETGQ